jgi:enolase
METTSFTIKNIIPRMILDSRGYPTVEVDIFLENNSFGRASVPSGASTGSNEVLELRDNDHMYAGKNVSKALLNIKNIISPKIISKSFFSQRDFDETLINLDGTKNKSNLGANAILALSLAYAKACASSLGVELYEYIRQQYTWSKEMSIPTPLINVLNGGKHATASTDVQEWMIVPTASTSFADALEKSAEVFYVLRDEMKKRGEGAVGDEGGFPLSHTKGNEEALKLLSNIVIKAGYVPGKDFCFALDVASSELYADNHYTLEADNVAYTSQEMVSWLQYLTEKYPIVSVEDGLSENDWKTWKDYTKQNNTGKAIQLVGDDLFVTNTFFIEKGIAEKVANAVLIKPNQIGTLTETAEAILLAQKHGYNTIISHRSGETEDVTIAHLAVASGAGQIKTGSLSRSERLAKYNELLRISEKVHIFSQPFKTIQPL